MESQELGLTAVKRKNYEGEGDEEELTKRLRVKVDTTIPEGRFWALAVELRNMICEFLDEDAIESRFEVADDEGQKEQADYFQEKLCKALCIDLSPEMAAGFKDFFTHPGSARHVAFVKHALVDIHRSTEVEALIPILLKFKTSLQTLSFTLPSSISNRTYATFDRCFATILNHVSALVLPTYNDGDASNIPSKQPDHVRNACNFFSPRSQEQIADIENYSKLAGRRNSDRICNKGFSELAHWPHIRKLTVEMSLAVKLRKNASSGENAGRELDIFIAPFAPVHLSRKLVAEKNGREVVELSIIHEITSPITVPIGPIFANMGWSDPLKLRSFNAATTDFTFYGACMLSDEPDEVPRDFIVPALESL